MGTWGPGNLDNDYALDELADRGQTLVATLLERAASPTSREGDEYDYTTLFVELEILFALDDRGLLTGVKLPSPAEVDALTASFLADWDEKIDALEPAEGFKEARRAVIADTFARLRRMSDAQSR